MGQAVKKRVMYFDLLNICAAMCVILLHCNGISHTYSDTIAWKQAMLVETVCYWAVPVFLMLSGANLMGYRDKYSTAEFFKKRFVHTVIPFVAWSLINAALKGFNLVEIGWQGVMNHLFLSKFENVYWFFIPLFAVYLAMPVLSLLRENRRILWYMVGGAFLLQSTLPALFRYAGLSWNGSLSMLTMGGYLIYPVLGYLLSVTDLTRAQRAGIYLLGIFGAALRYFGTWFLSARDGTLNQTFFSYTEYYAVFLSVAVFVLFKQIFGKSGGGSHSGLQKITRELSGCSFGVYLIHMTVYRALSQVIPVNCWEWRILVPFLIYAIAVAVTFVLRRIPIVKYIIP